MLKTPRYWVLKNETLGHGRGGQVYKGKARSELIEPEFTAVKIADKDVPSVVIEVRNEVEMLLDLDHPNIVKCCSLHDDDYNFYAFFEYLRGGNLYNRIHNHECFTEEKARDLTRRLLDVLYYLHNIEGVVHRDLKPDNIMFETEDEDADIRLIDFGFAVRIDEEGFCPKEVLGSTMFMAPELLRHEFYGRPVDMWALGIIVHMMLCGQPPFWESLESMTKLAKENALIINFEDPAWDHVSDAAKAFIAELLTQEPHNRLTVEEALNHEWVSKLVMVVLETVCLERCNITCVVQFTLPVEELGDKHLHHSVKNLKAFHAWNALKIFLAVSSQLSIYL
jgi:serine/threonine protein kinase